MPERLIIINYNYNYYGVMLRLWTAATSRHCSSPRCYEFGERRRNDIDRRKTEELGRKTCLSATLSTTNPTWNEPERIRTSAVRGMRLTAWVMSRLTRRVNPWRNRSGWRQSVIPSQAAHLNILISAFLKRFHISVLWQCSTTKYLAC
jgi:hypothetical protein